MEMEKLFLLKSINIPIKKWRINGGLDAYIERV